MQNDIARGLSDAQVSGFIEDGFVRIDNAFVPDLAAEARAILWQAMGLSPDEPGGWTRPVVRLGMFSDPPFLAAAHTPCLHAAYDALVGTGRWVPPVAVGTFPIRFPSPDDPGDTGWHVDMSFELDEPDFMEWRINVLSHGRALLMLLLFSERRGSGCANADQGRIAPADRAAPAAAWGSGAYAQGACGRRVC